VPALDRRDGSPKETTPPNTRVIATKHPVVVLMLQGAVLVDGRSHLKVVDEPKTAHLADCSDDDLMLLVRRGHVHAFHTLVDRHHEMVIGYASRFLGNRDAGEEVGQEVFMTVWSERDRYQAKGRFTSFLLSLTFNRSHVSARKRQRHLKKLDNLAAQPSPEDAGVQTPIDQILEAARRDEVHKYLAELPESLREAVILRYFNDMSLKEIAEVTEAPVGTVKSNLFRGLKRLHEALWGGAP